MNKNKLHLRLQGLAQQKAAAEKANRDSVANLEKEHNRLSNILTEFETMRGNRAKLARSIELAQANKADFERQVAWMETLENSHLEAGQGVAILQYHQQQSEAGAERALRVVERWLDSAQKRLAQLDSDIAACAEQHGIDEAPSP